MIDQPPFDVTKQIAADLVSQRCQRRRRWMPGLVLAALASGLLLVGSRPDWLEQPAWQLGVQGLVWLLCLVVFPAVGLGLLFPSRPTRAALVLGAIGLTLVASLGLPGVVGPDTHTNSELGCVALVGIYAGAVLAIGLLAGAFVQRRKPAAVYWIAAGVALTGLSAVGWHCPIRGVTHVVESHLGVAVVALLAASTIGRFTHRRRLSRDRAACDPCRAQGDDPGACD